MVNEIKRFRDLGKIEKAWCVEVAARLHEELIPEGFLVSLGPTFLKLFYEDVGLSPHSDVLYSLSSENDHSERVLGFISISTDTKKFNRWLLFKRAYRYMRPSIFLALINPRALNLVRLFFRRSDVAVSQEATDHFDSEVINFCVHSKAQGKGVAGKLYEASLCLLTDSGKKKLRIETGENQQAAINFYVKHNAVFERTLVSHSGKKSRLFSMELT